MDNPEKKSPNDILNDELAETEKAGKTIADKGRRITQKGQTIVDFARATRELNNNFPELLDIEALIPLWRNVHETVLHGLVTYNEIDTYIESSSGSAGTAATSVIQSLIHAEDVIPFIPPERLGLARLAIDGFRELTDSPLYKREALDLLNAWGFDKAPKGQKSAFDHIITAFNAYENPVTDTNPIMTSLIPMRECINTIIKELLRRCPVQQKTKNNYKKIISIGTQLKRDNLGDDIINELALQIKPLIDGLSIAKEANISRDEWRWRLNQATFFLNSLLHSLDISKINCAVSK